MNQCGTCRFWTDGPKPPVGPGASMVDTRGTCRWLPTPATKAAHDWCGQHKPALVPAGKGKKR